MCLERLEDTRLEVERVRVRLEDAVAPTATLVRELLRVVTELEDRVDAARSFVVQEICAHHEHVLEGLTPADIDRIEASHPLIPLGYK